MTKLPLIEIFRFQPPDPEIGMWGQLYAPGGFRCITMERPWKGNTPYHSCIPAGRYLAKLGTFGHEKIPDLELQDVPGRTLIELHPATFVHELSGCIAVGSGILLRNNTWQLPGDSRLTLKALLESLGGAEECWIWIANPGEMT
jgi:hypothetical protein